VLGGGPFPVHPDWVRSVRDQCQAAGVPFFFKQWGEWCPCSQVASASDMRQPHRFDDGTVVCRVGKKRAGRVLDGREWNEIPKSLNP
jgi:protein gp37